MDYSSLACKYGTPLYVYDFNEIQKNFIALKEAFAARKSLVCFAIKANSNLSVLKFLSDLGSGFDCVSIGELRRALYIGAKSYKIIFSGVGKQDSELEFALESDILLINLESEAEMLRLEQIAQNLNKPARISIRINPNVDAKTHPYISTGLNENKFGVSIETARKMYIYAKKSKFLNPVGIHFHIGSQLTDISPICDAAKIVSDLLRELRALEIDIKFFDVGGGIGAGILSVTRFTGLKEPVTGSVDITNGEIAEDLINYLYTSEQTPSSIGLGVLVSPELKCLGAGGFFLQPLPGASDEVIDRIEENLRGISSVSHMVEEGLDAAGIIGRGLGGFGDVKILSATALALRCNCSKNYITDRLLTLGEADLRALRDDGRAEVKCHFCNEAYTFDRADLSVIYNVAQKMRDMRARGQL